MNETQYQILTPSEFEALRENIPKTRLRIVADALMFTGMRYEELKKFSGHLVWLDSTNRCICIPAKYTKTGKERTIHLTPAFTKELTQYLREFKKIDVPSLQSMEMNMKRWNTTATPKTFRKSWETWLMFAGYDSWKVAQSQGHSQVIQYHHYVNLSARLKSEMEAVKRLTEGWGL